jgi:hypothetical protein
MKNVIANINAYSFIICALSSFILLRDSVMKSRAFGILFVINYISFSLLVICSISLLFMS